MASLKDQILQGFKNAGLSLNQAKIMAAEVGRENSFDPNVVFGVHSDPENKKTNVGMLSWQNGREVPLLNSLKSNGLIENGKIKQGQKAIDLMARYAVHEIRTKPEYAETKKQFLDNPNVPYKDATQVLGRNYIRWRYDDPKYASGHTNRDEFYAQLGGNPARQEYKDRSAQIVAAYKAKQKEQEKQNQAPKDTGRAQRIIEAYQAARQSGQIQDATNQPQGLPDFDSQGKIIEQTAQEKQKPKPNPTPTEKAIGVAETVGSLGTGLTTGALGFIGGSLGGISEELLSGQFGSPEAARRIEQSAAQGAERFTYAPRTETGQQYTQATGEALAPLVALSPATAEFALAAQAAKGVAPIAQGGAIRAGQAIQQGAQQAGQAVQRPIQAASNAVRSGVQNVREMAGFNRADSEGPAPANIGAAQVDQATIRNALAQELPYPPELTKGQLSRDVDQLGFEQNTARMVGVGNDLRQRYSEQHQSLQQNIDAFIDMTDATATNMREAGGSVDKALQKQMKADRVRVKVAYAKADKSEEAKKPVDLRRPVENVVDEPTTLIDYLNNQVEGATETIIPTARKLAIHHGLATLDGGGKLSASTPTIQQVSKFRTDINSKINNQSSPDIRQGAIIKNFVDEHIGPTEGALYKAARIERKKMADRWQNRTIITDLVGKKYGKEDKKVALEDVQKRIIHDGSLDDLQFAKRVLLTSGEEGKQAWKDIQGQTLQEIKNKATAGVAPDANGQQTISPAALNKAIKSLDDQGKLDLVFGKQGAEKLRALNEVSKVMFTVPAETLINRSGSGLIMIAALESLSSLLTGLPPGVAAALRIATKHIKDKKVKARVQDALKPQRNP